MDKLWENVEPLCIDDTSKWFEKMMELGFVFEDEPNETNGTIQTKTKTKIFTMRT